VVSKVFTKFLHILIGHSTGACILYGISRVVIGENKTFLGGEEYLKQRGIEVLVLENKEVQDLMDRFIREKPEIWYAHMLCNA